MQNRNLQEQKPTPDIDAEYRAVAVSFQKIGNAINPNPETLAAAQRQLGAGAAHFEIAANHVDQVFEAGKEHQKNAMVRAERIKQLQELNDGLVERVNQSDDVLKLVQEWYNDPKNNALPDEVKERIDALIGV